MQESKNIRDLTTGPVARKLYRFALPIICINLLQAVYNVVDMVIVGRFLGSAGITAVTVGGQIVLIVFYVISAFSSAETAIVGQLFGARKEKDIASAVNTCMIFALLIAAGLMIVLIGASTPLLHALNVPEEAFVYTKNYLIIYMCGTFFVYIYNVLYGLLRGIGESTIPMVFAVISTILNIALDFLFVARLSLGAGGAALATILCQALSMILIMIYVNKRIDLYRFVLKEFRMAKKWLTQAIKVGLPQMIQFMVTSLSYVLISALINSYGVQAAAAAGATNRVYTFAVLPGQALMTAIVTLTAQNVPNKEFKRIRRGLGFGILLSFLVAVVVWGICELFPTQMLGLFSPEPGMLEVGIPYMRIFMYCILVENIVFCMHGMLAGAGHTYITMVGAIIDAIVVRYTFSLILSKATPLGLNGIAVAYILAAVVAIAIAGFYTLSGRWKRPRIKT